MCEAKKDTVDEIIKVGKLLILLKKQLVEVGKEEGMPEFIQNLSKEAESSDLTMFTSGKEEETRQVLNLMSMADLISGLTYLREGFNEDERMVGFINTIREQMKK